MPDVFQLSVAAGVTILLIKEFIAYSTAQKKAKEMELLESRLSSIEDAVGRISISLEKLTMLLEITLREKDKHYRE
jgi:hypothetical protein